MDRRILARGFEQPPGQALGPQRVPIALLVLLPVLRLLDLELNPAAGFGSHDTDHGDDQQHHDQGDALLLCWSLAG